MNTTEILSCFLLDSKPVSCEPYGNGHINSTFLVTTEKGSRYILQRLNEEAFKDVPALMENISGIVRFLDAKAKASGGACHVLPPVQTKDGLTYVHVTEGPDSCGGADAAGDAGESAPGDADAPGDAAAGADAAPGYYRVTPFAEHSICLEKPESDEDFYRCAVAFGTFISELADYPAETLHETIPNFHNTPDRYRILHETLDRARKDPALTHRVLDAAGEIAFAMEREASAGKLQQLRDAGELPTRVTHNDTKLNNVLLDEDSRSLLYVIDLDTVMPGLSLYDYGDCIRFGAATAAEDEQDLTKVHCDLHLFEVFTRGFLESCKGLTNLEIELLPEGARTITLELGVRFLTDWLDGDKYFATKYPGHNLDRCRAQFALAADMEANMEKMKEIVNELSGN